jgi:hypothetical protein
MAAVAVLGIVVTFLAQAAIEGLAHEGDGERRMRASLLADRLLTDLEAELASGGELPIGVSEQEDGDLRSIIEIAAADPTSLGLNALLQPPGDAPGSEPPEWALLTPGEGGLRSAHVRVQWTEGTTEQEVSRTTFLLDPASVSALQDLVPPENPE